jgi:hypothetical protein
MIKTHSQQGLILSLIVFWLFLISLILLLNLRPTTAQLTWQAQNKQIVHLAWTREQLWQFSQQTPQLYATDTNGRFYDANRIPSPGYFPCPDTNNNGQSNAPCGQGQAIAIGRLPKNIATRSINFTPYHIPEFSLGYAVDSRYVIQNSDYHNPPIQRFAPLNVIYPGEAGLQNLQGQPSVALIFIIPADEDFNQEIWHQAVQQSPQHPDRQAFNDRFPLQQALTLEQWQDRMQSQVASFSATLCQLAPDQPHWFNACTNPQQPTPNCPNQQPANPTGSDWRALLC